MINQFKFQKRPLIFRANSATNHANAGAFKFEPLFLPGLKRFYYNRLPHLTPEGGCYFVTFCTYDSIPIHQAIPLDDRPFLDKFADYDKKHDLYSKGINLAQPSIAGIIIKVLQDYDLLLYDLLYYCIMPNHVHLIIFLGNMGNPKPLGLILKNIKGRSSREINLLLRQSGTFWQKASYDRLVRDEKELSAFGDYILENPVKAGLTDTWENWPYAYVKCS